MQELTSQYHQPPLVVDDEIPTSALRFRLGRVNCMTAAAEVELDVRQRAERFGYTPDQTEQTVRAALWLHEENRREYRFVMSGCVEYR